MTQLVNTVCNLKLSKAPPQLFVLPLQLLTFFINFSPQIGMKVKKKVGMCRMCLFSVASIAATEDRSHSHCPGRSLYRQISGNVEEKKTPWPYWEGVQTESWVVTLHSCTVWHVLGWVGFGLITNLESCLIVHMCLRELVVVLARFKNN